VREVCDALRNDIFGILLMLAIALSSVGDATSLCIQTPNCLSLISIEAVLGSLLQTTIGLGVQVETSMAADIEACFLGEILTLIGSSDAKATELAAKSVINVSAMCDNLMLE
jgi:hypothetical protein